MKISVAQTRPVKGDIAANIYNHRKLTNRAVSLKADMIFFPELSVTGYEPELARDLAMSEDDKRFDIFQRISDANKITIAIGAPTKANAGICISMIVFQARKPRLTYSKQQLHLDEFPYFINGEKQLILTVENRSIATAICYESLQPDHAENAYKLGAEIYIASVAKSQKGIAKALVHYPEMAKKFSMPVLMSNCVGFCDNFESAGKSGIWTKKGNLAAQLDDKCEGILIFDTETEDILKHEVPAL